MTEFAIKNSDKIVAIGEMGLDYDRLNYCSKDVQKKFFELQLTLCTILKLPMFLHCRNAADDFINILRKNKDKLTAGVVHSFDGNPEVANDILQLGLYIGINGWFVFYFLFILLLINCSTKLSFFFQLIEDRRKFIFSYDYSS